MATTDPPAQEKPVTSAATTKPRQDTPAHDDAAPGDVTQSAATGTTSTKFVPVEGDADADEDMEEMDMSDIPKCDDDIDTRTARVAALKKFIDTPDADDIECVPANPATTHPTMYDARLACTASHPLRQPAPPLPVHALPLHGASPRAEEACTRAASLSDCTCACSDASPSSSANVSHSA